MQQGSTLPLLGVGGLVDDAVGQELLAAAGQAAVPIQEVQLRLALVVLCIVAILQCSASMRLIHQNLTRSMIHQSGRHQIVNILWPQLAHKCVCHYAQSDKMSVSCGS